MKKILPLASLVVAALSACSGGSGGGSTGVTTNNDTVQGLDIPVTLSLVTPKETSVSARAVAGMKVNYKGVMAAFNDAGTDYTNAEQHKWVHDRALEPLDQVNEILCYVGQTGADQLVNNTYIALVDAAQCRRQGETNSGQNQSSGGGKTVEYEKWTVQSERADNNSPQYVRIWAPGGGGDQDPPSEIRAEVVVTEGVSESDPYGKFTLNWSAVATADMSMGPMTIHTGDVLESGTLKTVDAINGKIGFTMYSSRMNDAEVRKVSVVADADQSAGVAFTGGKDMDSTEKAYAVAFNTNNILVLHGATFADLDSINSLGEGSNIGSSDPAVCLSRTDFKRNVWRYDLFNAADGSHVSINSGFPFRWDTNGDGTDDTFGNVGYWGIWSEKTPAGGWNNVEVTKENFGSNEAGQRFVLTQTPGKLIRRERQTILLSDLDGQTFNYSQCGMSGCNDYIVEYDVGPGNSGGGSVADGQKTVSVAGFYTTHTRQWSQNGPPTDTLLDPPQLIVTDPNTLGSTPFLGMYSDGLGGPVNFNAWDPNESDHVTFYKETFVTAGDTGFDTNGQIKLDCYTRCLRPNISDSQYVDMNWPSTAYYTDAQSTATPAAEYIFDKSTMALTVAAVAGNASDTDVGKIVKLDAGVPSTTQGQSQWGIASDSMVPGDTTMNNVYDSWNEAVTYRWETGHNDWNKLVAVKDANGTPVTFDKPLAFSYKHTTANDANSSSKYDGKTFLLNYGGNGDLWGIPWVDASGNTGQPGPDSEMRPAFAFKDGVEMGPNKEYIVKAIDMELKPNSASNQCSSLVLNKPASPLPSTVDGTPSNINNDTPTPESEAPAVIGGELQ